MTHKLLPSAIIYLRWDKYKAIVDFIFTHAGTCAPEISQIINYTADFAEQETWGAKWPERWIVRHT
jgi:hypothetical protein